jgi:dephospho-CoA kinase
MQKIGITGGIGSGKSTVCNIWESLGAGIIKADDLAKEIMMDNPAVKQAIINTFGDQSYQDDGSLNRSFLAKQVFEKRRVEELNAIVHPYVSEEIEEIMQYAETLNFSVIVYEAALLLQNGRPGYLDSVVLVLANKEQRLGWVQQRDETSPQLVLNRMKRQQDFSKLSSLADDVIENNGSLEELKQKAEALFRSLQQV